MTVHYPAAVGCPALKTGYEWESQAAGSVPKAMLAVLEERWNAAPSDSNDKTMEEGRSAVPVGGRADEIKDEEGRMDVAVGRSVVERNVEEGP